MREAVPAREPDENAQLWMFDDAPVVPMQSTLALPMPEPVEPEAEPHPDLFLAWQLASQPDQQRAYYLLESDDPSGPFAEDDIVLRLKNGLLSPDTYGWYKGLAEWMRLGALFPAPAPAAPHLAGFNVRFAAGCMDLAIILLAYFVLMTVVPPFRDWIETASLSARGLIVANIVLSLPVYGYFLALMGPAGKGRTPGYRFLHIRLVDQAAKTPPGWRQACLWCVASLTMIVGWPFYWLDPGHRMLHNRLSRTIVVNDLP